MPDTTQSTETVATPNNVAGVSVADKMFAAPDKAAEATGEQKPADTATDKTPEQLAAEKAEADKNKTPEQIAQEKADADKAAKEKADAEAAVPVDLTGMTMPEGIEADPAVMADLAKVAGELKLDKAGVEKLLPIGAKIAGQIVEAQNEAYGKIREGWRNEVAQDKNLSNYAEVVGKAMQTYGSEELKKVLNETGLGDNPELARFFYKIGQTVKEDKIVTGQATQNVVEKSAADKMFPSMAKKA